MLKRLRPFLSAGAVRGRVHAVHVDIAWGGDRVPLPPLPPTHPTGHAPRRP